MRVATKAREQSGAGLERIQQVKRADGTARAVRLLAIPGNHQRGTSVALHHPRGGNADHSAVPPLAIDHNAESVAQRRLFFEMGCDRLQDAALFLLPVAVQLIELV